MRKRSILMMVIMSFVLMIASGKKTTSQVKTLPGLTERTKIQGNIPVSSSSPKVDVNFGKVPLYFITNNGQVNPKARYYAKASRYTLWLTKAGLVFDSTKRKDNPKARKDSDRIPLHDDRLADRGPEKIEYLRDVSMLLFVGANKKPEIIAVKETKLRVNYFKGNDKSKWHCDVPTSQAVLYKNLYKNIDLKVYGLEKQIEYDWIVKPGGNPADIKFVYKNVRGTRIDNNGNLLIETDFGELIHKKPVSYQENKAEVTEALRQKVDVNFKKTVKNTFSFAVGVYDKSRELIIDPVVLTYSTYLGGENSEIGHSIAVDSNGYAYVGGLTWSTDFPTLNQYQINQSSLDVFIAKIDTTQSGTSSLVYSTYLGGKNVDSGLDIAVDNSGNAYVTGLTHSTDFPTLNQFQSTSHGASDAFVTKIDTNQAGVSSLIYSTYLGGSSFDSGSGISVDNSGNAFLSGGTDSTDFPTLNPYQTYRRNGDAFVTKIDTTQVGISSLIYSTYLGGSSRDCSYGIAIDSSGNVYVT